MFQPLNYFWGRDTDVTTKWVKQLFCIICKLIHFKTYKSHEMFSSSIVMRRQRPKRGRVTPEIWCLRQLFTSRNKFAKSLVKTGRLPRPDSLAVSWTSALSTCVCFLIYFYADHEVLMHASFQIGLYCAHILSMWGRILVLLLLGYSPRRRMHNGEPMQVCLD